MARHLSNLGRVILIGLCLSATSASAPAQSLAKQLTVDREILEGITDILGFDDQQTEIALALHAEYLAQLDALAVAEKTRLAEAGGREIEETRRWFYGEWRKKGQVTNAEADLQWLSAIQAERAAREEPYRLPHAQEAHRIWRDSYALITGLLDDLEAVCYAEQQAHMERARRFVRRALIYGPPSKRAPEVPSATGVDFVIPDLFRLVDEASEEGGELFPLRQEPASNAEIEAILLQYELTVDQFLRPRLRYEIPQKLEDLHVSASEGRQATRRWGVRFGAARSVVQRIAEFFSRSNDLQGRERWMQRWHTALAPRLHQDRWMDGMLDWLKGLPDLEAAQRERAQRVYEQYLRERALLRGRAVKAAVNANGNLYSSPPLEAEQARYWRLLLDLRDLHEEALNQVRDILTAEQNAALNAEFERLRQQMTDMVFHNRLFGPTLRPYIIEYLKQAETNSGNEM